MEPTTLTTEQLHRELGTLERLIGERLTGTDNVINERFASMRERLVRIERLAEGAALAQERLDERVKVTERRLDRDYGTVTGAAVSRTERRLDLGQLIAVIAVIIAAISVAAYLLKK